jgi:molecular chaperone HtpG
MAEQESPQTFDFQAEVKQLLQMMVHSLYSNREIFLRELISNASDASDKLRFEALAKPGLLENGTEIAIRIELSPEDRLLSISDDGIGMSREEVIEQLGTIAHSGTARFVQQLNADQRKDSQLIGQFGVGFYSAFIVAEEVEVLSRRAGLAPEQGVRWRSDGQGEYQVESVERAARGTTVRLRLRADAAEFLDEARVRALVRKYSDHIGFPIRLQMAGSDKCDTINQARALWTRPRNEVTDEEYIEFYRHIAHDFSEPLSWSHNRVEGKREFTSLLYIPATAPFDLWNRESPRGIKLYVRKVFITDQATQFLPLYLRFVRGVLDSSDLPLNVSREVLQQDEQIGALRSALTRRVLDMLGRLAKEEPEKYLRFWKEFGTVLKEGLAEDPGHRDRLTDLLRFSSTHAEGADADRSLADYVDAAEADQPVYYLIADSLTTARASPHLEAFRERGTEVLLLTERLDEWLMQHLTEYRGRSFRDVSRGELGLAGQKDKPADPEGDKARNSLLKRVKRVLREKVEQVRMSERLTESASCIVLGEHDLGYGMRDLLRAAGQQPPDTKPILELNPGHALVRRLEAEADESRFEALALLMFEQAVLAEGRALEDPAGFVKRINRLLSEESA